MSCFLSNSSLGKKLVMSVTGCFLVLFILFHMSMNIVAIISPEAYNMICALLGANWYALAGTAVLAAGVVVAPEWLLDEAAPDKPEPRRHSLIERWIQFNRTGHF